MTPSYRCWTKATDGERGPPRYSANWAIARRGWFKVFPDRVECGDWSIPASNVVAATLFHTRQWLLPVTVLSVETAGGSYQFGFNPWVRVSAHLPFPHQHEHVTLRYSTFSVAVRVALIAYIAYIVLQRIL